MEYSMNIPSKKDSPVSFTKKNIKYKIFNKKEEKNF